MPLPSQNVSSNGDAFIQKLHYGPVQMYITTLTCTEGGHTGATAGSTPTPPAALAAPPPVTLVAETAQQLLWGIRVLGQLQPFTILLVRDMSMPADTWPKDLLVNRSMVLAGLPPPAPRTLLDLYQVSPKALTLNPQVPAASRTAHPSGTVPGAAQGWCGLDVALIEACLSLD